MTRLLILSCGPLAMLSLGGWWRLFEARLRPVAEPDAPAPGEVPLARLVRDVLWRLDGKAARQFARLEVAVAENLTIGGDRQVIDELLSALCLQAIQTTPCGTVVVSGCQRGSEIALTIADDGTGIATTRTAEVVARARELLALLGGRMDTKYEEGAGASVTVLLPTHTAPWNATIENTMADFARVTAPREPKAVEPATVDQPS